MVISPLNNILHMVLGTVFNLKGCTVLPHYVNVSFIKTGIQTVCLGAGLLPSSALVHPHLGVMQTL